MPFITSCTRCGHCWQEVFLTGHVPANAIGTDKTIAICPVCQPLTDAQAAALLAVAPTIT
jgi:hypothetical protein